MKRRPKSTKHQRRSGRLARELRGLTQSEEGYWRYQGTDADGNRTRVSLGRVSKEEAIAMRDELLRGVGGFVKPGRGTETRFAEVAALYLQSDPRARALAATTRHDRERLLKPDGRILRFLGDYGLDEITSDVLERYWIEQVLEARNAKGDLKPRTPSTGEQDLAAIAAVLRYARKTKRMKDYDPCSVFKRERADTGTKAARAEKDPEKDVRPVDVNALSSLVAEARKESLRDLVCVLLQLDAGLRTGEALGLRWGDVIFGNEQERNSRKLSIEKNRPRGGAPDTPKSGRSRTVGLSLRLRSVLLEYQREQWNPSADAYVLHDIDPNNWRRREWRRITKRAGIAGTRVKDLRDTFASVLLSNGIQLVYVSRQLGHSKTAVTEKSYAKWCHRDDYVDPVRLSLSQLPTDLLAGHFDQKLTKKDRDATAETVNGKA